MKFTNKKQIPQVIRDFAKHFGIKIKVAPMPKDARFYGHKIPKNAVGVNCGNGVILIPHQEVDEADLSFIVLHEIGHSVLDFYSDGLKLHKFPQKLIEVQANAIAIAFASFLRIPITQYMIYNSYKYLMEAKIKGKRTP